MFLLCVFFSLFASFYGWALLFYPLSQARQKTIRHGKESNKNKRKALGWFKNDLINERDEVIILFFAQDLFGLLWGFCGTSRRVFSIETPRRPVHDCSGFCCTSTLAAAKHYETPKDQGFQRDVVSRFLITFQSFQKAFLCNPWEVLFF